MFFDNLYSLNVNVTLRVVSVDSGIKKRLKAFYQENSSSKEGSIKVEDEQMSHLIQTDYGNSENDEFDFIHLDEKEETKD